MADDPTTRFTVNDQRSLRRPLPRRRPCLIQYTGDALGRRFLFDAIETTLGRSPGNGFVVLDDSVSRTHLKCHVVGDAVEIEDLSSRNGTFVNEERVRSRARLQNGDIVRIGSVLFKFFAYDNIENAFHDKIYRLATVDAATDTFNKNYLIQSLESEFALSRTYERPLAVIYYDLDFFKKVNDEHGHGCGDYVLKETCRIAKSCVRKDDIVGRLGGEEFLVILPNADAAVGVALAERIRGTVEAHAYAFEGKSLRQTVSLGVAQSRLDMEHHLTLLNEADRRLYESKRSGRNRVTG
jgi:diguanylate cyclase (GGDEF)-like protein